jgi:hypothetical protein
MDQSGGKEVHHSTTNSYPDMDPDDEPGGVAAWNGTILCWNKETDGHF